ALPLQPGFAQQGVDLTGPAVQDLDPVQAGETVGQRLRLSRVIKLGERVVVLHEAAADVGELAGQPVVTVDVNLGGEREAGLNPNVTEAELRVEEVEVEDALGPAGENEPGPAVAITEFDRAAGLLTTEDADQPFAESACADLLLDEVFLAMASLEVDVRS